MLSSWFVLYDKETTEIQQQEIVHEIVVIQQLLCKMASPIEERKLILEVVIEDLMKVKDYLSSDGIMVQVHALEKMSTWLQIN